MTRYYVLSEQAKEQLKEIYKQGYINFGEQQAESYFTALCNRFDAIVQQPFLYPTIDNICNGYRRSICGKHSIFYKVTDTAIEIIAILRSQNTIDFLI
jgi:toxin ParE1/3/4